MARVLEFIGIDGSNPLAFLAAIGTLRSACKAYRPLEVRMSWRMAAAWRPVLHLPKEVGDEQFVADLNGVLADTADSPAFAIGEHLDLEVPPQDFRKFAKEAAQHATPDDRAWADFAAAYGCDATTGEKGGEVVIQDTSLRTMSGAGHQHFLEFMRNIIRKTTTAHLHKALFEPWRYDDPVEKLTMRWDPCDDQRYALRWGNPSGDKNRKSRGSMLGANRLAIEGLPMFPTIPQGSKLATTGFVGRRSRDTYWAWPIWQDAVSLDVVRSLVSLKLHRPDRELLAAMGIAEIYRSQRLTIGKVRNFTPAQPAPAE